MYLARLIYTSCPSKSFKPEDIEKILTVARKNNVAKSGLWFIVFSIRVISYNVWKVHEARSI